MRRATRGRAGLALALLLAQGLLGADCVDGKTPDCSDPNAKCGPDLDGAIIPEAAADAPADGPTDAGGSADAADSGDAAADASADAPADAPDGG